MLQLSQQVQPSVITEGGDQEKLGKTFKEIQEFPDYNTAFSELEAGTVDAVAMDVGVAKYQVNNRNNNYVILDENLNSETVWNWLQKRKYRT
mgnify:CR=1 FL=1